MLQFENVSKSFLFKGRMMPVLSNASFTAHFEENFGLLIPPRSGATTIQNLILGSEQPDSGKVYRYGKISWPVGGVGGLITSLSGSENCRYIAMIYGLDPDDVLAFTIDLARIGRYMDMPVRTYSSTLQKRLSIALLLSLEFDMYLVVNGAGAGDPEFANRAGPLLKEKLSRTPIMFLADSLEKMKEFCHRIAVVDDYQVYDFDRIEDAEKFIATGATSHG
jgi:capsular polysaccharide transport system ATP-binding protein